MGYVSQEDMREFVDGLRSSAHSFSESDIERIEQAMKFYFGYKKKEE